MSRVFSKELPGQWGDSCEGETSGSPRLVGVAGGEGSALPGPRVSAAWGRRWPMPSFLGGGGCGAPKPSSLVTFRLVARPGLTVGCDDPVADGKRLRAEHALWPPPLSGLASVLPPLGPAPAGPRVPVVPPQLPAQPPTWGPSETLGWLISHYQQARPTPPTCPRGGPPAIQAQSACLSPPPMTPSSSVCVPASPGRLCLCLCPPRPPSIPGL